MVSRRLEFKQMRHFADMLALVTLAAVMLSGCVSVATRHVTPEATTSPARQSLSRLVVPTPAVDDDVLAQLLDAQFALDHNDLGAAAKAYAKASVHSQDPEVAKRAAQLATATHDSAAAHQAIGRWIALGGHGASLAQLRAQLALDSGDTDGARKQLLALVQSGDKDAWRLFGQTLMSSRDPAQAGQLLKEIARPQSLPSDPAAWLAMSEMGTKLGQVAYAREIADAAVKRFGCANCYAWAAQLQYQAGHPKAARELYAKAVAKAPDNEHLRIGYAGLLGRTGDNAGAARLLAKGKQTTRTYQLRAAYAARAKDNTELAKIYQALSDADDDVRQDSVYLLGQLAGTLGHSQQALDWFAQVPADSEHRFDADMHSALLWQQRGDSAKAHAQARQMQTDYAEDPKRLGRAFQLDAELYMGQKQYTKAIDSFTHALKSSPQDTRLLYGRGIAYAESDHVDPALADFRAVLKLKPDDIDAANALGFTLADADRDLDQAHALIEQARKARPDDPAIADSWGWLQYRLGHLDAAQKTLRKAWDVGKDPDVGGHLVQVLWQQGHRHEAQRVLAAARKLAPDDASLRALQAKIAP